LEDPNPIANHPNPWEIKGLTLDPGLVKKVTQLKKGCLKVTNFKGTK